MRRTLLIATLCLLAVALCGCKKARLRAQLMELMGSTIVLPENISCVYNGEVYPMPDSLREKPKLIVYIDSAECTTCRISRLGRYKETKNLLDKEGISLVVLLENTLLATIPLERYLQDH